MKALHLLSLSIFTNVPLFTTACTEEIDGLRTVAISPTLKVDLYQTPNGISDTRAVLCEFETFVNHKLSIKYDMSPYDVHGVFLEVDVQKALDTATGKGTRLILKGVVAFSSLTPPPYRQVNKSLKNAFEAVLQEGDDDDGIMQRLKEIGELQDLDLSEIKFGENLPTNKPSFMPSTSAPTVSPTRSPTTEALPLPTSSPSQLATDTVETVTSEADFNIASTTVTNDENEPSISPAATAVPVAAIVVPLVVGLLALGAVFYVRMRNTVPTTTEPPEESEEEFNATNDTLLTPNNNILKAENINVYDTHSDSIECHPVCFVPQSLSLLENGDAICANLSEVIDDDNVGHTQS